MMYRNAVRLLIGAATLAGTGATAPLPAQEIRGIVVEANDTTLVSGAVVLLLHATKDSIYARIVTGQRGAFTLSPPVATPVRLRVLRLGYEPTNAGTYSLASGQTETVKVKLRGSRVILAAFDVAATRRCEVRPGNGLLVAQLYEEARKALLASATPTNDVFNQSQFTLYSRAQDLRGKLVAPIERNSFAGPSSKPFASLSPDSLAIVGYVVEESDGTVYRAPDAEVLLADSFLQTHCLQLLEGTGDQIGSVGIAFKPVARNTRLIDVRGTLWLDRESNELQHLEYEYVGIPEEYTKAGAGGRVDYTQMSDGLWFANKWMIRMPRLITRRGERVRGQRGDVGTTTEFSGLQITGGEVQWLKVDGEAVYNNTGAVLAGSEPRDLQNVKVTAGTFEVDQQAERAPVVTSPVAVDTMFSASSCAAVATTNYTGHVKGNVRDNRASKATAAVVVAEWKEDFRVIGQRDLVWQFRRLETRANENGDYEFCGLPLVRPVSLSATNGGRKSRVALVRLTDKEPRTSMQLAIGDHIGSELTAADTRLKGAVLFVVDPFNIPLAYATVNLGGNNTRVADRDGRINLSLAPRDTLRLVARKMGYASFTGKVARDSANGAFRVTLSPVVQNLKTVTVNDRMTKSPLERTGFYERAYEAQRGAVVGEFFTPEDIEARPAAQISDFLRASRYVQLNKGQWTTVLIGRGGCASAVVLDGIRMRGLVNDNRNKKVENAQLASGSDDVNTLANLREVAAIEVYPSAVLAPAAISSQVSPAEYVCGIVAIWTGSRTRK